MHGDVLKLASMITQRRPVKTCAVQRHSKPLSLKAFTFVTEHKSL